MATAAKAIHAEQLYRLAGYDIVRFDQLEEVVLDPVEAIAPLLWYVMQCEGLREILYYTLWQSSEELCRKRNSWHH